MHDAIKNNSKQFTNQLSHPKISKSGVAFCSSVKESVKCLSITI